jgi:hypothetical protein
MYYALITISLLIVPIAFILAIFEAHNLLLPILIIVFLISIRRRKVCK